MMDRSDLDTQIVDSAMLLIVGIVLVIKVTYRQSRHRGG